MAEVLVACPTAQKKDYALEAYLAAYTAMEAKGAWDDVSLFMVDTTPGTYEYMDKLHQMGINAAHIEPPGLPMVDCLVYTVNKAWEMIVAKAWMMGVDYILSIESDVIVPYDTCDCLTYFAEEQEASVVAHSYPYAGRPNGIHSLGCLLFERKLFECGESLHNPKNPNLYAIGGGGNFEDAIFTKPIANGKKVIRLDGFLDIKHWQTGAMMPHAT